jgi:PIN domain nuclease of toxin-antitoxin system
VKRYLLDTHALVFWSLGEGLSPRFAARLDRLCRAGRLAVSAVSFWETALLAQKGRIELPDVAGWKDELVRASGLAVLTPDANVMIASALLPPLYKDPMDRLIVAHALAEGAVLVSRDAMVRRYPVPTLWQD